MQLPQCKFSISIQQHLSSACKHSIFPPFHSIFWGLYSFCQGCRPERSYQEFQVVKSKSSLCTFCVRHYELVDSYGIAVSQMTKSMYQQTNFEFIRHRKKLQSCPLFSECVPLNKIHHRVCNNTQHEECQKQSRICSHFWST